MDHALRAITTASILCATIGIAVCALYAPAMLDAQEAEQHQGAASLLLGTIFVCILTGLCATGAGYVRANERKRGR